MLEKQLVHQAHYDEMTDLLNRRAIYEWFREHMASENHLVCMLLDIDDFKSINDTYGHMVGDEVKSLLSSFRMRRQKCHMKSLNKFANSLIKLSSKLMSRFDSIRVSVSV